MPETIVCISCGNEHCEKFCPECGERAHVPPIAFGAMIASAFSTISNMDRGFLYNIKYLTLQPKSFVEDYLKGKRKGVFNPISFLIIVVTLFLIWDATHREPVERLNADATYRAGHRTAQFIVTYFKYFWLLSIVWLGLGTRLLFAKYNLAEHFAIGAFIVGQASLVGLLFSLIHPLILILNPIVYAVLGIMVFRVFNHSDVPWGKTLAKTLLTMLLFMLQLVATIGVLLVFVNGWAFLKELVV